MMEFNSPNSEKWAVLQDIRDIMEKILVEYSSGDQYDSF